MTVIPHYQQAELAHGDLPDLSEEEYIERMRTHQRNMVQAVDRDRWRESTLCEPFTERFVHEARRARSFVDVGAEAGFYAYLALKNMPRGGRITAIEPDPIRCALLRELFEPHPSVRVIAAAVSDARGTATLIKPRGCSATFAGVNGERFEAPTVALDDVFADCEVDLIKMDIEGAEARALLGMRRILAGGRTLVFLEYHPWIDDILPGGVESMHRVLAEAGYRIYRTDHGPLTRVERLGGRVILAPAAAYEAGGPFA